MRSYSHLSVDERDRIGGWRPRADRKSGLPRCGHAIGSRSSAHDMLLPGSKRASQGSANIKPDDGISFANACN